MKITVEKHYSLEEINNALESHFKNYTIKTGSDPFYGRAIWIKIPNSTGFFIRIKGKEIILSRSGDFGDFILALTIIGGLVILARNDLSNNLHAKEILDLIKNDMSLTEVGTENMNEFPSICPHCKSPNNKKLKTCEWCGGKML